MPLDSRKWAHIKAVREKMERGREEVVLFVARDGGGAFSYGAPYVVWYEAGRVPSGVANRIGEITRSPFDAILVIPVRYKTIQGNRVTWEHPDGLKCVCRIAVDIYTQPEAAIQQAIVNATAEGLTYTVLGCRLMGLGSAGAHLTHGGGTVPSVGTGDRWVYRLRQRRN